KVQTIVKLTKLKYNRNYKSLYLLCVIFIVLPFGFVFVNGENINNNNSSLKSSNSVLLVDELELEPKNDFEVPKKTLEGVPDSENCTNNENSTKKEHVHLEDILQDIFSGKFLLYDHEKIYFNFGFLDEIVDEEDEDELEG